MEELLITPLTDTTICLGDSYLAQFSILAGIPSHIVWSLHPDYSEPLAVNQQQITVQPTEDTQYYLLVEGNRCSIERSFTVHVSYVTINEPEPVRICFEDSIRLTIHATGGNNLQYDWQPSSEISSGGDSPNPWIHPSASLTYTVTVTNEYGCSATASIPVTKRTGTFSQPLEAWCDECAIIEGTFTTLHSTQYGSGYTYQWTPSAGLSSPSSHETSAMPSETTTYTITVTDQYGCSLSKEITIEVQPLTCDEPLVFVPNTFTPNGDGKNDILYVRSSILKDFSLRIYNRWGELIFETDRLDKGWDGSYKGKPCEQGVYDYYLTGTCVNDEKILKKGNISLIY